MDFQISPLSVDRFAHLFGMDEPQLATLGIGRSIADSRPGYPCRVSLRDADVGESVLLMNFEHQPAPTPFRSSHAIYVREGAREAALAKNDIPPMLRTRLLSVRAFDTAGTIVDADVIDGRELEALIERMFAVDAVDYVHLHNAKLGCYLALGERA